MLVAVGLGALAPAQVKTILESQDPLGSTRHVWPRPTAYSSSQCCMGASVLPPAPCRGHSSGATDDPGHSAKSGHTRPNPVLVKPGSHRLGPTALLPSLHSSLPA